MAFIDDITLFTSSESVATNANKLRLAYRKITSSLQQLGLEIEASKIEAFHFSAMKRSPTNRRLTLNHDQHTLKHPVIFEGPEGDISVAPKNICRYLGFFFDPFLSFDERVMRYTNKALSTAAALRMISNSMDGPPPSER